VTPFHPIDCAFDQQIQKNLSQRSQRTRRNRTGFLRVLCDLCESHISFGIDECTIEWRSV